MLVTSHTLIKTQALIALSADTLTRTVKTHLNIRKLRPFLPSWSVRRTSLLRKNMYLATTLFRSPTRRAVKCPRSLCVKNLPWLSGKSTTILSPTNCLMRVCTKTQPISSRSHVSQANARTPKPKEILILFQMYIDKTTNKNSKSIFD